jgi:anti-anti-sigma factor
MQHHFDANQKSLTVIVPGDVLSTNAEELRRGVFALLDSPEGSPTQCTVLTLDLTRAHMVDSVGLNLLVTFIRSMKERGGKVQALITSDNIERTFIFTRLNQMLELVKPGVAPGAANRPS